MSTATLSITFESDWHVGDGAGALGYIDRIVRRDPSDGLPYVPAKTLTGMLRDGCERVAIALDRGEQEGPWSRFVTALFGRDSRTAATPGNTLPAAMRIGPARYADALRAALARPESAALAQALTRLKPGVKLDANGTAAHDMLRIEEMAIGGCALQAEVELDAQLTIDARRAAQALISAGCAAVDRIGGKRRRGHGRCRLRIDGWSIDRALLLVPPPAIEPIEPPAPALTAMRSSAASAATRRFALLLEAVEPLQIPAETIANLVRTRDHVPGSLLLAALDPTLRQLLGERATHFTRWVAEGALRIGFAYPDVCGKRGLPVPLCVEQGKLAKDDLRNRLHGEASDSVQRKPLRRGYVAAEGIGGDGALLTPTIACTHATIDDAAQRPTEAVGGVYTYEAIAPGSQLQAEIAYDESRVGTLNLASLTGRALRLGRAKKDDYGRVRVLAVHERPKLDPPSDTGRRTVVFWLIAPALLRDETLEPVTDAQALARVLARTLGLPEIRCTQAFYRLTRDEGWNVAWREPRPTRAAFAAGSVFALEADWTADALARLAQGVGERRGEGYGEVRIDAPLLMQERPAKIAPPGEAAPAASAVRPLAPDGFTERLHRKVWLDHVRRAAIEGYVEQRQALGWRESKPNNAQLGALLARFQNFERTAFDRWLQHLNETPNRKDKWPAESLSLLNEWLTQTDRVWGICDPRDALPLLPGHDRNTLRARFADAAARLYWLTLIGLELDRRQNTAGPAAGSAMTSRQA